MTAIAPGIENLSLSITEETHVRAPLAATFAALLEELGPANEGHNGTPMPMTLEPRPGGPGGSATSVTATGTYGVMCRRSSDPRCSRSLGR